MFKKLLVLFGVLTLLLSGCGGSVSNLGNPPQEERGGFMATYDKPLDFDHYEMFISTTPNFSPTGWDGAAWASVPNVLSEWNGTDKNLHSTYTASPMTVSNLIAGKTYYYKIVVVDKAGQRGAPSVEQTAMASPGVSSFSWVDDFIQNPYNTSIWTNTSNSGAAFDPVLPHGMTITISPEGGAYLNSASVKCSIMEAHFECNISSPIQYCIVNFGLASFGGGAGYSAEFTTKENGGTQIYCVSDSNSTGTSVNFQYGVTHDFKIIADSIQHKIFFYIDNSLVATHDVNVNNKLNLTYVTISGINENTTNYSMEFDSVSCSYQ
jgi:hypothetical protein